MGIPLKQPPLFFALVQVRFNSVLTLPNYVPVIQESLRKAGFPDYARMQAMVFQLQAKTADAAVTPIAQENFTFGNAEKTQSFTLAPNALTFHSTNYDRFERFSEIFLTGLATVHEAVQLDFVERIGLRYLNHVAPGNGETLDQYLVPEVLGMRNKLAGEVSHSYSETLIQQAKMKLRTRVTIQTGALALPPDLTSGNMAIAPRFTDYQGPFAILDNDGFVDTRETFALPTISGHLQAIHEVAAAAFQATVTPNALKAWGQPS